MSMRFIVLLPRPTCGEVRRHAGPIVVVTKRARLWLSIGAICVRCRDTIRVEVASAFVPREILDRFSGEDDEADVEEAA